MFVSPNVLASIVDAQVEAVMSRSEVDADSLYDILYENANLSMSVIEDGMTLAEKVGPAIWKDMHYRARSADREGRRDLYHSYIYNLARSHPCLECREHMKKNLITHPPSRYRSAFVHSVMLHNTVNTMLGKPTISYNDALSMYDIDCETCSFRQGGKSSNSNAQSEKTDNRIGARIKGRPEVYHHSWGHPHDRDSGRSIVNRGINGYSVPGRY